MRVHVEWINKKLVSPYLEPGDEGKNKQLGWDGHSEVRSPIINTLSPIGITPLGCPVYLHNVI